jgi:hypothetical protein
MPWRRELLPRDAEGVPNARVTAPHQPREAGLVEAAGIERFGGIEPT